MKKQDTVMSGGVRRNVLQDVAAGVRGGPGPTGSVKHHQGVSELESDSQICLSERSQSYGREGRETSWELAQ